MKGKSISIMLILTIVAIAVGVSSIYYFMRIYLAKPHTIVPDLIGKSIEKATDIATKQGIFIKVDGQKPSPLYPANAIISQVPEAGTRVVQGDVVHVYVSSGVKGAKLELIGKKYEDAVKEIEARGLSVGDVLKIPSETVPQGTVIAQYPIYIVSKKISRVDLIVSTGKPPTGKEIEEKLPEISSPPSKNVETQSTKEKTVPKPEKEQPAVLSKPAPQREVKPSISTRAKTRTILFSFTAPKKKKSYRMTVIRIDKDGQHIEMQKEIKGGEYVKLKLTIPREYNVIRILLDGKFFREDRYY